MTIWWCEEHKASGWGMGKAKWCHLSPAVNPDFDEENYPCRMVEMDLVPHETSLTGVTIEGVKPIP